MRPPPPFFSRGSPKFGENFPPPSGPRGEKKRKKIIFWFLFPGVFFFFGGGEGGKIKKSSRVYELYKDRVYSVSLYFFHGDEAVASDVTQQVFLKLITTISQFKGDAAFSTWLYRLVVNACQDSARRRKSAVWTTDRSRLEEFAIPGSQEDDYARAQIARSVRAAVSALPPKFRIVVLLRYFDALSYEQMA